MNYHAYYPIDVINGPGTRCTLFVSGCEHRCKGCYNPITWNKHNGQPFNEKIEQKILEDLTSQDIPRQGLSLSGGDPLLPDNLASLNKLIDKVKKVAPEKDIWCWTGYRLEELSDAQRTLVKKIDILVDGQYQYEKSDAQLVWRGSTNQRIISIKKWQDNNFSNDTKIIKNISISHK